MQDIVATHESNPCAGDWQGKVWRSFCSLKYGISHHSLHFSKALPSKAIMSRNFFVIMLKVFLLIVA